MKVYTLFRFPRFGKRARADPFRYHPATAAYIRVMLRTNRPCWAVFTSTI